MASREREASTTRIGKSAILRYRRLLDRQADVARRYIASAIETLLANGDGMSVSDIRMATFELFRTALPNFTELSSTLSCEFMREICVEHGWDDVVPETYDTTDWKVVDGKLRYFARALADGDVERFRREVSDVTGYFVRRAAQDSLIENCERAEIRYARVPTGLETCSFCFMLASRGFVYRSELTAGLANAYHRGCDCIVVPGAKGRTQIDGYDPAGMAARWNMCADAIGGTKRLEEEWATLPAGVRAEQTSKHGTEAAAREAWVLARIRLEVETRDWRWLYTGEPPKADFHELSKQQQKRMKRDAPQEVER